MKRTPLLAILLAVFVLQSCQKELDPTTPNNPTTPAVLDSLYMHKIYEVDTTVMPNDSILGVEFFYDANKRVVLIDLPAEPGAPGDSTKAFFFYQGNDTVPYKSVAYVSYTASGIHKTDTSTGFYFYDALGRKIKDSTYDPYEYFGYNGGYQINVETYSYAPGRLYKKLLYKEGAQGVAETRYHYEDTAILDSRNNVVSAKQYLYDSAQSKFVLEREGTFSYDNKPNPFLKLSCIKAFSLIPFGEAPFFLSTQVNNFLNVSEIYYQPNNSPPYNQNYSYIYRANGYVKEVFDGNDKLVVSYKAL